MVSITLYTAPSCGACTAAKHVMTKLGIPYTEVSTAQDPAALAYLRDDLGYTSAPVTALTYRDGRVDTWGGFDLNQIRNAQQVLHDEGPGPAEPVVLPTPVMPRTGPEVAGAA